MNFFRKKNNIASDQISNLFFQNTTSDFASASSADAKSDKDTSTAGNNGDNNDANNDNLNSASAISDNSNANNDNLNIASAISDNSNANNDNLNITSAISDNNTISNDSHNVHAISGKKNTIIITCIACLVIALAAVSINKIRNNKDSVSNDFIEPYVYSETSVFSGIIDYNTPITEYLGSDYILHSVMSGYSSISGNITLKNLKNAANNISGTSLDFKLNHNGPKEAVSLNSSLRYRGEEALAIEAYLDTKALSFKIPYKSDKLYSISFDNLKDNIINTPEISKSDIDTEFIQNILSEDTISKLCGDFSQLYGGSDIVTVYINTIKEDYPKDYKKIIDNIVSEDAEPDAYGNSGKIYTISEEGVETLVKCVLTVTLENEDLYSRFYPVLYYLVKNDVISLPSSDNNNENKTKTDNTKDKNSNDTSISTAIDDLLYNIRSTAAAFAMVYSDSVSFTVWRNSEGMLTGLQGDNDIKINNDIVSIKLITETRNETNPIDNSNTALSISYGNESFEFHFNRRTERDSLLKSTNYISFNLNNKNKIEISSIESLDTTDNEYEYNMDISSTSDVASTISIICTGSFSNIVKDYSFDFNIKNMYINEGFTNLLTVNGDLSVSTGNADVNNLSGEVSELTEMSAEELAKLFGFSTK